MVILIIIIFIVLLKTILNVGFSASQQVLSLPK